MFGRHPKDVQKKYCTVFFKLGAVCALAQVVQPNVRRRFDYLVFDLKIMWATDVPAIYAGLEEPYENTLFLFQIALGFIAATRSFEPDPHRETDLSASVKGTSRGCTRSGVRI